MDEKTSGPRVTECAHRVHPSGRYAWFTRPESPRAQDDVRLGAPTRSSWEESEYFYGYRKGSNDLRDQRESFGKHRVARRMRLAKMKSETGYARGPHFRSGKQAVMALNHLQHHFAVGIPNKAWVTDITYIRTHDCWPYLVSVLDPFSRQVVSWSMGEHMTRELATRALLMAVWRRKPTEEVAVHSDQGNQFDSHDWQDFLKAHNLKPSMSLRGNCHVNAAAEGFFQLLKRERIKRKIFPKPADARADVFDRIEMF